MRNSKLNDLIERLDYIKNQGCVIFIKIDGERSSNCFVSYITSRDYPDLKNIIVQGDSLEIVLEELIEEYEKAIFR